MERIFALHNWPDLPAGVIGSIKGPMMASAHSISITITGKGGHGAMPHLATPQMAVAAHVQLAINSYLAQQKDTRKAAIISPTQITAGDAFAVLPKTVTMKGSCRFLDEETTQMIYRDIPPLVQGIASSFGADAHIELCELCPVTKNDSDTTDIVRNAAAILDLEQAQERNGLIPAMVSEDFAYMLKDCPGCYFWLGQKDTEHTKSLHQPNYDFNDDTIGPAVTLLAEITRTALPPSSS
ncbi:MAG: M20/M25/M40 family metallo-hydrolase, partial [Deltaproteobacteria bacterium]